ncbi:hypothetical protein I302_101376 [Kwoniella bestiolae CBS 10118]|uniref:Uncharacterized protein n=1 Tax=Kwoniella bestiolae CBS 10118 TaxID=1296100 RepID=A0A1B9GC30_9TREE|nr:hypothetical protein I302_00059 [Kwoniella bestiolae CBS 10118]OCF28571.1 hypothetical protein I302_00059 [Kwoniella bestiolae CBS 10118]
MSITVPSLLPPSNLGRLHEMVWSIPNIRSEIMLYLPNRDIISLLTTSKIHFHSAVEKLYEVFPYKEYENILTRCKDKTRKQAYWNAVRTIKLNRTLPPTKWVRYFGPFPNATCIQAPPMYVSTNPAMIFRTNEQGHYRFVFQPEESFKGEWQLTQGSVIPERIIGTPSAWGYRQPLTIMLSHPPSTLSPKNESNIMTNLLKINESPEYFVRSLELHVEVDRPAIFQALQQLHSTDKLRLQCLKVSDFNAETTGLALQS